MIIRLYYKGKTEKIDISNPLTYDKVTNTIEERFGLPVDRQLLIVNNNEVTPDADFRRLKVHLYPIEVKELKNLNVSIGKLSFPLSFYFGFKCSVLCSHILDILRSNSFEIPNFDFFLEIDGKAVDINSTLESIGAVEDSSVAVYSDTGNLSDYFYLNDDYSNEPSLSPVQEEEIEPKQEEIQPIQEEIQPQQEEIQPNQETQAETNDLVTVHRRQPKDSRSQPKPTTLPESILALLSTIRQALSEQEEPLAAVTEIEKVLLKCQDRLFDAGSQLQQYEDTMTDIHYENQMLREMYKTSNPSASIEREIETQKNSWKRASLGEDSLESLPDDVDELKKLVHEKYAVALMNERRFEKERKRCKKWKLAAQTLGVNDDNIDEFYSEYHGIVEHRDQLKEQNLDLREQLRKINSVIDAKDDELRRLTETIQCRDATIAELAERIENNQSSGAWVEEIERLQKEKEELQQMIEQMENMQGMGEEEGKKKLELVQKQLERTQIENATLKQSLEKSNQEEVESLQSIVELINDVIAKKSMRR